MNPGVRRFAALLAIGHLLIAAGARADSAHFETWGLQVYRHGEVVLHVWLGQVTGFLPVPLQSPTDTLEVRFFDPDSVLYVPPVPNAWLKRLLSAPSTAHYDSLGQWKFSLTGLQPGAMASIYLRLWYQDHFDYTSPPIPYVVNLATGIPEDAPLPGATLAVSPNPLSARGVVRYTLTSPEHVRLDLYDASGRRLQRLLDADRPAGIHDLPLDPRDQVSGVYFVRLETSRGATARRLLMIH